MKNDTPVGWAEQTSNRTNGPADLGKSLRQNRQISVWVEFTYAEAVHQNHGPDTLEPATSCVLSKWCWNPRWSIEKRWASSQLPSRVRLLRPPVVSLFQPKVP